MLRSYLLLLSLLFSCLSAPVVAREGVARTVTVGGNQELLASSLEPPPKDPEPTDQAKPQAAADKTDADKTAADKTSAPDLKSEATNSSPGNPYPAGSSVAKIYDLGEQQLKSGDLKQARETFRALAYKRPQDPVPMLRVAVVCARAGDLDEALVWTKKAVAYGPSNVDAHLQLAHLLESNQELLQAALQYETAYSYAPTGDQKVTIESAWVRVLVKCQHYDKASRVSLDVLKEKRSVESLYNRAWVLSQIDKSSSKDEAIKTYRKILDMDPGRHDARFNLASLLAQTGRKEEAIAEFRQFIQDAPEDPDAQRAKTLISKLKAAN